MDAPRTTVEERLARPTPPAGLLRALGMLKAMVLGAVVAVAAAAHVQAAPSQSVQPVDQDRALLEQLLADHRCSTTGFDEGTWPATALLRTESGALKVVSFARGWAAHEGAAPGALVAVCLGGRGVERP